jgi:hypothetical protein
MPPVVTTCAIVSSPTALRLSAQRHVLFHLNPRIKFLRRLGKQQREIARREDELRAEADVTCSLFLLQIY